MRSEIKRRFYVATSEFPYLGDYMNLLRAIRSKHYKRSDIVSAFNLLVPKEDYAKNEKKQLIDYLVWASELTDDPVPLNGSTKPRQKSKKG